MITKPGASPVRFIDPEYERPMAEVWQPLGKDGQGPPREAASGDLDRTGPGSFTPDRDGIVDKPGYSTGISTVREAPPSGRFDTVTRPPRARTISRTIASPNPVPPAVREGSAR